MAISMYRSPRSDPRRGGARARRFASWLLALAVLAAAGDARAAGLAGDYGGCAESVPERVIDATPSSYQAAVAALGPGDLLRLAAGSYASGLTLHDVAGEAGRCIVIEGPASGAPAVFTGRDCCNTVSLENAAYLVIRNLELDGQGRQGDGVKAEGTSSFAHHITLENLDIHDHDAGQQIVGINTKCPAWSWLIRRNVIARAGTGLYLGDSDGSAAFVNGLIEHNLITETLGYNLQIKHQNDRDTGIGAPAAGTTIIRHNVLSKAVGANGGDLARPNLLLGHWPLTGAGADDDYLVYGNFFYQNPAEALLQAEGNVALYGNLLVNDSGPGVHIQPHNDLPRRIRVFQNTVVASGLGIRITGGDPGFEQRLVGNAVFAAAPLAGGTQLDNVTDNHGAASSYLTNPDGVITGASDRLDLFPLAGTLEGPAIDRSGLVGLRDWDRDFNGRFRPGTRRGAYAGEGNNPGWLLALARKPALDLFADGFESGGLAAWSSSVP